MNNTANVKDNPFASAQFSGFLAKGCIKQSKRRTVRPINSSSRFYDKSLTLLLSILKKIDAGNRQSEIAQALDKKKSHISYYVKKATAHGYIIGGERDVFKPLELTQAGKNFVDRYTNSSTNRPICRLENIRFKAPILAMPSPDAIVDWEKVEMNNWVQYNSKVDSVMVRINQGKSPTIEFIPSPVDGDDPLGLRDMVLQDCVNAREKVKRSLGIEIGRLESNSLSEYVVYDPLAKAFSNYIGQVTIEGVGKVNASKPGRKGEFEFHDPRACAIYMSMPRRVEKIEQSIEEIREILGRAKYAIEPQLESLAQSIKERDGREKW